MNKVPISIIIDDPAPGVHVYRHHIPSGKTQDGRELLCTVPNSFLDAFADVIGHWGLKGKFSAIPMAACQGSIAEGFAGVKKADVDEWVATVRARVMPQFAICSELLTHHHPYDMHGGFLPGNEQDWIREHGAEDIAEYIGLSLHLLDEAGLTPTGVTSPWSAGIEVEDAYADGISRAFRSVLGKDDCWYFLHCRNGAEEQVLPVVTVYPDGRRIVSMSATFGDNFWQCIDTADTSEELVRHVADGYITEDGQGGEIRRQLEKGTWPVLLTHWQSLYSNGLRTGLRALELVGERVAKYLGDEVEWMDFTQIMRKVL